VICDKFPDFESKRPRGSKICVCLISVAEFSLEINEQAEAIRCGYVDM
jgi:hypothetical protein